MGPLQGVRVIEFGGIGPGPFCGMILADMGADVVVIDRKTANPNAAGIAGEPRYDFVNRGKRSIAVDLKQAPARDALLRLIEGADVVLEGFRPGVMEKLGLGPDECLSANPALVYGRMTGWGQHGPLSHAAGHDLNYIALSGALYYGARSAPPMAPPTLVGDIGGGAMVMAMGLMAALLHARSSGEGQVIDTAVTDGSAYSTALVYSLFKQGHWSGKRHDNLFDGAAPWYDCYECADGDYVSVGSLEPGFYRLLLEKLGLAEEEAFANQYDKRRWPELKERLRDLFRSRTRDEWCELLEGTDVCFAPVLDFDEAVQHPHNAARETFIEVGGVTQPAPAPRFSKTPSEVHSMPPSKGEHGVDILAEAGFSAAEIEALKAESVI